MRFALGMVLSFVYVFSVIGAATVLSKLGYLKSEGSRKFIHIGVGNWWLIAMAFFDAWWQAALVPVAFVFVNYLSYKRKLFAAIERGGGIEDLGTVWYALSLAILSALTFAAGKPWIGAIGILCMTWGDGLAAVAGSRPGRHPLPLFRGKSLEGTVTMFAASFAVALSVLAFRGGTAAFPGAIAPSLLPALILAAAATLLESATPSGFDNLSVPLGVSLLARLLVGGAV